MHFWQKFLSQGYVFLPKSLTKGICFTKTPRNWHFGPKLASVFGTFLLNGEYLGWNSLKFWKNGPIIRKFSLAKGMLVTKISLVKGIWSKTEAAHPCQKSFAVHHKGQRRGALMFSLICAWINGSVNNCEAGDLGRHRAHYDLTVMLCFVCCGMSF